MTFRLLRGPAQAAEYATSLDTRWPDRAAVIAHLSAQLMVPPGAHIVELCAGAGTLARTILADHPGIRYTGLDFSPHLLAVAEATTAQYKERVTWIETDLTRDGWQRLLAQPVSAVVSLQSLHDLGDENAVATILGECAALLSAGGQMLYADLLAEPVGIAHPGRLTVARHLDLLSAAGFTAPACTFLRGPFGCFCATRTD